MASFIAAGTALRHPRRADGAVLHLLFDVRLPAGRRPHLAGGRRPRPRLPARRHRRAHDAARRGPAAPGRPQPRARLDRARRARPTTRRSPTRWRRSCRHGLRAHVRRRQPERPTSSTTSPSTTRTTRCRPMPDGVEPSGDRARASTSGPTRPTGPSTRATILFSGSAHGAAARRPPPSWPSTTTSASSCGRPRRTSALREEALDGRALEPPAPGAAAAHAARRPSCSPTPTGPIVAVTDFMKIVPEQVARFVPGRTVRPARHRRDGPLRHPRGAAPPLRDRRRPRRGRRAGRARRRRAT